MARESTQDDNKSFTPIVRANDKWRVLIGAIVIQLILGTVYGYSIFWEPLDANVFPPLITAAQQSEMLAAGQEVSGFNVVADEEALARRTAVQRGYLRYAFSICILAFAVTMVIAGRVQDVKGPRFTAIIGAVLMSAGFLIAGLMNHFVVFYLAHAMFVGAVTLVALMVFHAMLGRIDKDEMPVVQYVPMAIVTASVTAGVVLGNQYVGRAGALDKIFMLWGTIGFLAGAGIGFAYVCPIAALIKWFPQHKGLVSGLAVAGFGFGAYLFSHKDLALSAENFIKSHGINNLFVTHGLVCLVGVTLGALLLRNPPGAGSAAVVDADSTWQQTLRRPAFYVLWLMFFSGAVAGLMVIGILKGFAGEQLVNAAGGSAVGEAQRADLLARGVLAVGWLAIFNAVGRVAWGFISDRIGRTPSFVTMFIFQAVTLCALSTLQTELSLAVGAAIIGFNFGGNFALFPSATADLFGARNLGANYGWVFTSYGIAGVVGIAAGNAAKTITGSYNAAFIAAAALCVLSAVLAMAQRAAKPDH